MRYHFKNTFHAWQTILAFIILLGASVFILSVFVLAKYTAESRLLLISNSTSTVQCRNYCYGDFGNTLSNVIKSDVFLERLNQQSNANINKGNIRVKNLSGTNIVIVQIFANSPELAQRDMTILYKYILQNIPNYFAKNDAVAGVPLQKPKLINRQQVIIKYTLLASLLGLLIGLFIVWFTELRFKLFKTKDYNHIVEKKIKEELAKNVKLKGEIYPEEDSYTFNRKNVSSVVNKEERVVKKERKRLKNIPKKIKAQLISLNISEPLKPGKTTAPDNLPIFTVQEDSSKSKFTRNISRDLRGKEKKISNLDASKKKNIRTKKEKPFLNSDLFAEETRTTARKKTSKEISSEVGRQKKPSAHNIANGFAVDKDLTKRLESSEDIKDRLNKLLRGDL